MAEPYFLEENASDCPFVQFDTWFKDVCAHKEISYEEMNAGKDFYSMFELTLNNFQFV